MKQLFIPGVRMSRNQKHSHMKYLVKINDVKSTDNLAGANLQFVPCNKSTEYKSELTKEFFPAHKKWSYPVGYQITDFIKRFHS